MLAVVLAATVSPYLGAGTAQTSCAYPPCPPAPTPSWVYALIAVGLIAAALAFAFVLMRRRRRPPAAGQGVRAWEGGAGPGASRPAAHREPPAPPPEFASLAPVYLETPEETEPTPPTVEQGALAGAGAAAAEEADTAADTVRAELERISQEILRRSKEKRPPPDAPETDDESHQ